jgi:hypothetical protein
LRLLAPAVEIEGIAIGFWDRVSAFACLKLGIHYVLGWSWHYNNFMILTSRKENAY